MWAFRRPEARQSTAIIFWPVESVGTLSLGIYQDAAIPPVASYFPTPGIRRAYRPFMLSRIIEHRVVSVCPTTLRYCFHVVAAEAVCVR